MGVAQMERVRAALEAWRREQASERIAAWRDPTQTATATALAARHGWLASREALDELLEAAEQGQCDPAELAAARAHLAEAAAEQELAPLRDELRRARRVPFELQGRAASGDEVVTTILGASDPSARAFAAAALDRGAAAMRSRWLEERGRADERAAAHAEDASADPDAGEPAAALASRAEAWLEASADAADEALAALGLQPGRQPWQELAHALRMPELDALVSRTERWRRVAAPARELGFERDMSARMRAEPHHGGLDPRARVAAPELPRDVRTAQAPVEHGLLAELSACEAVGRALGLALVAPALPVELRHPVHATVARAVGALFAQLLGDPLYLRRAHELDEGEQDRVAAAASAAAVLQTRLDASAVLARARLDEGGDHGARAAELASGALRAEVPEGLAAVALLGSARAAERFRARTGACAAWVALRERYDEDWFRNPRVAEPLRAACHRGGLLSIEAWCEELGASVDDAAGRLHDWRGAR